MTTQESFKKRIRSRMARTGERYTTARRALLDKSQKTRRPWVAQPEMDDDAIFNGTGKYWDDWCDIIDAWSGCDGDHTEIARHVREELGVDPWWSQTVTVGYERITGRRLPYQRPDGSFTASKSRTVTTDRTALRAMLIDDDDRADLFPGFSTTLRSKATSKTLRVEVGPGVAAIGMTPRDDGRTSIGIEHAGLPSIDEVEQWKLFWSGWLDAVDDQHVEGSMP